MMPRKGFAMDDERLKQGNAVFGKDYFSELLERVRSIRTNEHRIWQQITNIFMQSVAPTMTRTLQLHTISML